MEGEVLRGWGLWMEEVAENSARVTRRLRMEDLGGTLLDEEFSRGCKIMDPRDERRC